MSTATPQDTFDHTIGAGSLTWPWWLEAQTTGVDDAGHVSPDWSVKIMADSGDDAPRRATLNHDAIMAAARAVLDGKGGKYTSDTLKAECRRLIFDADEADFDASTGDELLQVAVLGEVIFG